MRRLPFTGLRPRLILLVLLVVLPALGLAIYSGLEQRQLAAAHSTPGQAATFIVTLPTRHQ
jgi:hypothetical protein